MTKRKYRSKSQTLATRRSSVKKICCICNAAIPVYKCKSHLLKHGLENVYVPDFYKSLDGTERAHKSWYNESYHADPLPCGAKFHGAPVVKIIYNPVATNRRRH
jgi:hypothetical protein